MHIFACGRVTLVCDITRIRLLRKSPAGVAYLGFHVHDVAQIDASDVYFYTNLTLNSSVNRRNSTLMHRGGSLPLVLFVGSARGSGFRVGCVSLHLPLLPHLP